MLQVTALGAVRLGGRRLALVVLQVGGSEPGNGRVMPSVHGRAAVQLDTSCQAEERQKL